MFQFSKHREALMNDINIEKFLATSAWYLRISELNTDPTVLEEVGQIKFICTDSEWQNGQDSEYKVAV